jgi:LemA protein
MWDFLSGLFWLLFWIVVALVIIGLRSYNKLQRKSQSIRERASNVQVAISRKLSLINQLIDVVRNFQESEQFTHLKISQDATNAGMLSAYQQSGTLLTTIQGMAQRFPELRANEQYHRLVDSIQHCESDIQNQRQAYNAAVNDYNSACLSIPTVFVARLMGFSSAPYLEFDMSGARDVTSLKEFRTDDGERLQQLLVGAGGKLLSASKSIAAQATDAGRQIAGTLTSTVNEPQYFFMIPGAVPEGPKALADIRRAIAGRAGADAVMIAESGSSEWRPLPPVT